MSCSVQFSGIEEILMVLLAILNIFKDIIRLILFFFNQKLPRIECYQQLFTILLIQNIFLIHFNPKQIKIQSPPPTKPPQKITTITPIQKKKQRKQYLKIKRYYNKIIIPMYNQNTSNTDLPYMTISSITVTYCGLTNYRQMLEHYDPALLRTIESLHNQMLSRNIYLFKVTMVPENLEWKIWKSIDEIYYFLGEIKSDLYQLPYSQESNAIQTSYQQMTSIFDQSSMPVFVNFINQMAKNLYLRKTEQFLLFIQHCVSVDKWDMKIYQQMTIEKAPTMFNKFTGMFASEKSKTQNKRQRDFFLTITSDGILKSDNHLLESRILFMIPFTNQLTVQCKVSQEKFITFVIQSCAHEQMVINFFKNYDKAINFSVGLKMALDQSSYSDHNHRFKSYSPERQNCASKLYCDGAEYYEDLFNELQNAQKQVCITGWMITPYFLLKRPNSIDNKQFRLDGVLQSLAERGVKVYIIVFMEPKLVVNNDSQFVQTYMESLHDNIKVYRHPNGAIPLLWSHHQKMVIIDQSIGFMGGLDICYGRWDYYDHPLKDPGLLWDGADYNNYRTKDITQPRNYKQSNLDKDFQVRMPWHDIALQYRGDIVLDLLRHFVQYWYFVKSELLVDPMKTLNFLKRRYEQAFYNATNKGDKEISNYYVTEIKKREEVISLGQKFKYLINGRQERFPQLFIQAKPGKIVGNQKLQMCRSASQWSIGVRTGQHQSSIHQAYQALIKEAEKFIYIQNQFFMGLENKVVECLAERITRAAKSNDRNFKVIIVMPLLPGFEGNIADPASTVLRIQVHHQFQAILRNKQTSLFSRLAKNNVNPQNYIHFFGLRNCQVIKGWPQTEIIYVHSKLMIVDDKRCIIGSANINDRSLLGNRDSQLACIIQDNGNGNIFNLRCKIFLEHFGLNKQKCAAFTSDEVWREILYNSKKATQFYARFFRCTPDDFVTVGAQIDQYLKGLQPFDVKMFEEQKKYLRGHAVDFPLIFMQDEDLRIRMAQKEYYAPQISFT